MAVDCGGIGACSTGSAPVTAPPFSFCIWFYRDRSATLEVLADLGNSGAANDYWRLRTVASGTESLILGRNANSTEDTVASTAAITGSAWQHAGAVITSATDAAVFLNGTNKATSTVSRTPATPNRFRLSQSLDGPFAEAALWSVALTDEEMFALGAGRLCPLLVRPASLLGYWPIPQAITGGSPGAITYLDRLRAFDLSTSGGTTTLSPSLIYPQRRQAPFGDANFQVSKSASDDLILGLTPGINTDLISAWNLNESSGNAADSIGSNILTNNNAVTYVSGKLNNAASFVAASSQSLSIASNSTLNVGTGNFAFACWVKHAAMGAVTETVLCKRLVASPFTGYDLRWATGILAAIASDVDPDLASVSSLARLDDGAWHFIVANFTRAGNLELFVDNVSQGTAALSTVGNLDNTGAFQLGNQSTSYLDGQIDAVLFRKGSVFSADEIAYLYANSLGREAPYAAGSESAAITSVFSTTETLTLSLTESDTVTQIVSATETLTLSLTESVSTVLGFSGTDDLTISLTDSTLTIAALFTTTETLTLSITDAGTADIISLLLFSTDTLTLSLTESSARLQQTNATDNLNLHFLSYAETGLILVTQPVTDTLTISISDISTLAKQASVPASDTLTLSLTETSLAILQTSVADTLTFSLTDVSALAALPTADDTLTLSLTDASSSLIVSLILSATDDLSIALTDITLDLAAFSTVTDTLTLSLEETNSTTNQPTATDSLVTTLSESITLDVFQPAADTLTLSFFPEESMPPVAIFTAPETLTLALTETVSRTISQNPVAVLASLAIESTYLN